MSDRRRPEPQFYGPMLIERRRVQSPVGTFREKRGRIGHIAVWARRHQLARPVLYLVGSALGSVLGIGVAFVLEYLLVGRLL